MTLGADIDTHSETWRATRRWLDERRERCVAQLITGSTADDKLRGEIRLIDELITDAEQDRPPIIDAESDY